MKTAIARVRDGAFAGAIVWATYGIAECFVLVFLPALAGSPAGYGTHSGLTIALLLFYPAFGLLVGGALAVALAGAPEPDANGPPRAVTTASLALTTAFAANLLCQALPPGTKAALLLVTCTLAATLVVRLFRGRAVPPPLLRLTHPGIVSLGLLGAPWLTGFFLYRQGETAKGIIIVFLWLGLLAGSALYGRFATTGPRARRAPRYGPEALALGAMIAVSALLAPRVGQQPLRQTVDRAAEHTPPADALNLILITLDTVRADHLSVYGYPRDTSPNLRRLAAEGSVCRESFAASDMTLGTHASLFTGLYPSQHGAHYDGGAPDGRPLAKEAETLSEILARAGYRTGAVVSNHGFLGRQFGFAQGFEYYDAREAVPWLGVGKRYALREIVRGLLARFAPLRASEARFRDAAEINRAVRAALPQIRAEGRPFFLFVNYMDAHEPYLPPPPYDTRWPGKIERFTESDGDRMEEEVMKVTRRVTERERAHLISQYDGSIAYLDDELSKLVEELRVEGLLDRTLLIVTSDHGEAFGERNLVRHGVSVYQDLIFVPLVIRDPLRRLSPTLEGPCHSIDVLPTVLEALRLPALRGVPGTSLLHPSALAERTLVSESFTSGYVRAWHPRFDRIERAVVHWPLKLVESTAGKKEGYDLSADPTETSNLFRQREEFKALEEHLDRFVEASGGQSLSPEALDESTLERLRGLGYVR